MEPHEAWHVIVLTSTVVSAAGAAVVVLAPLLFDRTPAAVARARRPVAILAGVTTAVLIGEWLLVHGRFL